MKRRKSKGKTEKQQEGRIPAELEKIEDKTSTVEIVCEPENFEDTLARLKNMGAEFITISAEVIPEDRVCLCYYFQKGAKTVIIRIELKDRTILSLYSRFNKSDFIEREINNLFGIKFVGHPNLETRISDEIAEEQ